MTLLKTLAIAATGLVLSFGAVQAAEGQKPAKDISFSFEGPFGTFDRASCSAATRSTRKSARPATP